MTQLQVIAQILGFIGMGVVVLSFQIRSVKKLFISQLVGIAFFTTHFVLLGAYTGAIQNLLALLRCVIFLFHDKQKWARSNWVLFGMLAAFLISGIATYSGLLSLLPMIAMLASTVAMWTGDGFKIRLAQLCLVSPSWLIYNASVFSISGVINESLNITSVIISFVRYKKSYDNIQK